MKKAFTLAEVLITLTIIGVIAAITIPNLMQKWQDHSQITAVKEAYAILDNAIRMAVAEHGPIDEWGFPSDNVNERSVYFGEMIKPYLKVVEDCSRNQAGSCFNYGYNSDGSKCTPSKTNICGYYLTLTKEKRVFNAVQDTLRFKLTNNMRIYQGSFYLTTDYTSPAYAQTGLIGTWKEKPFDNTRILVDTNGEKGPNMTGYDIFLFGINRLGLMPLNTPLWQADGASLAKQCSIDVADKEDSSGNSCYYWIWKHNNMDYKHRKPAASEW